MNQIVGVLLLSTILLFGCGGASSGTEKGSSTNGGYSVSVNVSGLSGGTLVLQNNGRDDLSVSKDGSYTFATSFMPGAMYSITVYNAPSTQHCSAREDETFGKINNQNITVPVTCTAMPVSGLSGLLVLLKDVSIDSQPPRSATEKLTVYSSGTPSSPFAAYRSDWDEKFERRLPRNRSCDLCPTKQFQ